MDLPTLLPAAAGVIAGPRTMMKASEIQNTHLSSGETMLLSITRSMGRAPVVMALDAVASVVAYACMLRFVVPALGASSVQIIAHLLWLALVTVIGSRMLNVYNRSWRFISFSDLSAFIKLVALITLSMLPVIWFLSPRFLLAYLSFFPLVLSALIIAPRLLVRSYFNPTRNLASRMTPLLIAGAGWTTEAFVRATGQMSGGHVYRPVGILARSPAEIGRTIHGVPIVGTYDQLSRVTRDLNRRGIHLRHLALSSCRGEIDASTYDHLRKTAQDLSLQVARLPRITELEHSSARSTDLIPAPIADLLGRTEIHLDSFEVNRLISGRRVLITGAGGTIGSELSRQIARIEPRRLLLLDNSEYNLYRIELEIRESGRGEILDCLLCDVRDPFRVGEIFARYQPEIVFHAAAVKHVPIVEQNLSEGVLTNVLGTCNVADAALASGAHVTTLISTDKAVNPANVLGVTKRIGECYGQSLCSLHQGRTHFLSVRFGNVAASSGSVIPLFQRQIALGGPVTVTHPEVRRFFMTCEEAVQLVLQATSLSLEQHSAVEGGHVYALDMGEPIRIAELAAQMIRLAGLAPGKDVEIRFVGLRSGEKLEEALFHEHETVVRTRVAPVSEAISRPVAYPLLRSLIDDLVRAAQGHNGEAVRRLLAVTGRLCEPELMRAPPEKPTSAYPVLEKKSAQPVASRAEALVGANHRVRPGIGGAS